MKHVLFVTTFLCSAIACAQDVIVKRDGSTILSKVLEVNAADIKYKKFSNQDGPTYSLSKAEIMSINYENGEKDTFEVAAPVSETKVPQQEVGKVIDAQPDARNAELISLYNRSHDLAPDVKRSNKKTTYGCFFMAVDENSVLSTSDIEISFEQKPYRKHINETIFSFYFLTDKYVVQIYNKTDKTIFVDMGNTFRVMSDGTSKVYYDLSQTTVSSGSASSGSLGVGGALGGGVLGGVNLGGSSISSTSKTYAKQRVMSVPPHGKMPLEVFQQVQLKAKKSEIITEGESSFFTFPKKGSPAVTVGEKLTYDSESTPFRAQYTISYSLDDSFSTVLTAKCTLYARDLYGMKDFSWNKGKGSPEKALNEIKETVPDYDDFTIVGSWYESSAALLWR